MEPDRHNEARVLEYNGKEGLRTVGVFVFTRRVLVPATGALLVIPITALISNGIWAGLMGALLVGLPLIIVWRATFNQWAKVREYLKGYKRK